MSSYYAKISLLAGALATFVSIVTGVGLDAIGFVYLLGAAVGIAIGAIVRLLFAIWR